MAVEKGDIYDKTREESKKSPIKQTRAFLGLRTENLKRGSAGMLANSEASRTSSLPTPTFGRWPRSTGQTTNNHEMKNWDAPGQHNRDMQRFRRLLHLRDTRSVFGSYRPRLDTIPQCFRQCFIDGLFQVVLNSHFVFERHEFLLKSFF